MTSTDTAAERRNTAHGDGWAGWADSAPGGS
jgi:hypothetical protein